MLEINTVWNYPLSSSGVKTHIEQLSKDTGQSKQICTILYNRGFRTKEEIFAFFDYNKSSIPDPRLLKDLEKTAEKVVEFLKAGKKIVQYSDYDADGAGCVHVLNKGLKNLGYNIDWFTNERSMGYGLSVDGVKKMMEKFPGTEMIITSDNGIVAFAGIEYANSLGITVCVTDHHKASEDGRLPDCYSVVNPNRLDDTYPFKGICGTTVVYKLLQVIYEKFGRKARECEFLLDFVAIATIADVMPMLEENRIYVKEGLKIINDKKKNVWKYAEGILYNPMYDPVVNETTIGFSIGPMINACSRLLGNMEIPISVFLLDDEDPNNKEEIISLFQKMQAINTERKQLSADQTDSAFELVGNLVLPIIVIHHESFHEGLVGIIAGRITEKYCVPSIVLTRDHENPKMFKGSGRSVAGFNIFEELNKIQREENLLHKFGGHEGACGLTIAEENLEEFGVSLLIAASDQIKVASKEVLIDIVLEDSEYTPGLFDEMKSLAPYGEKFREPTYGIRNFEPQITMFGGEKKDRHLKFLGKNIDYINWNSAPIYSNCDYKTNKMNCIGKMDKFDTYSNKLQLASREFSDISFK